MYMYKSHAMISVKISKKQMGWLILSLILLKMLVLSTTPCEAARSKARFERFKGRFASYKLSNPNIKSRHENVFKGRVDDKDHGDEVFNADKRNVYTGPNPLHNK